MLFIWLKLTIFVALAEILDLRRDGVKTSTLDVLRNWGHGPDWLAHSDADICCDLVSGNELGAQ